MNVNKDLMVRSRSLIPICYFSLNQQKLMFLNFPRHLIFGRRVSGFTHVVMHKKPVMRQLNFFPSLTSYIISIIICYFVVSQLVSSSGSVKTAQKRNQYITHMVGSTKVNSSRDEILYKDMLIHGFFSSSLLSLLFVHKSKNYKVMRELKHSCHTIILSNVY